MLPEWSPHAIANIIFTHQIRSRVLGEGETFVMVEGKTDHVLWEEYRSKEDCTIYPVRGKGMIVAALNITKKDGNRGVAGIVDGDYWLITQSDEHDTEHLLYDDCCPDAELILLKSPALKKALRNHFYNYDIEQVHELAERLKEVALRLAMEFGYFRLLNHYEDHGISFKEFWKKNRHINFLDEISLEFYREQFSIKLKEFCPRISTIDLLMKVDVLKAKHPMPNIQLCQGHDVIAIMAAILPILFRSEFGEDLSTSVNDKELSIRLRTAYEYGYFSQTSLFACIKNWEAANDGKYMILKPDI